MFCGCFHRDRGAAPNSHCCPVCLGPAGVLPTINKGRSNVIPTGFAIEAAVAHDRWDRRTFPIRPAEGYQISSTVALAANGRLTFDTERGPVTVRVRRLTSRRTPAADPRQLGGGGSA